MQNKDEKKIIVGSTTPQPRKVSVPIPAQPNDILNLVGSLKTTTTTPTLAPKTFADSIVLYVDSLTTPTVMRLYAYSAGSSKWGYAGLTIV